VIARAAGGCPGRPPPLRSRYFLPRVAPRRPAARVVRERLDVFLRLRPAWAMERFIDDIPRFAVRAAPRAADVAPRTAFFALRVAAPRLAAAERLLVRRAVFLRPPALAERDAVFFLRGPVDVLRARDEDEREVPPDERRDDEVLRLPPGSTFTARLARSAIVPAAVVTTEPTVLAAVPTPEATESSIPPLLSSAIIPPRKLTLSLSTVASACRHGAWYPFFYSPRRRT